MGKRGPRPRKTITTEWSNDLAYAVGLLAADGCLSTGNLIDLTSKDKEQVQTFVEILQLRAKIGVKKSGSGQYAYRVQFKNVFFYEFLLSAGLTPAKSKTLGALQIPDEYFFHFLRGAFDGDGSTYSYFDPRWKASYMFYTNFVSASHDHIEWLQHEIYRRLGISGYITVAKNRSFVQLRYAKADSLKLLRAMYPRNDVRCLSRKRLKIQKMLRTIGEPLSESE